MSKALFSLFLFAALTATGPKAQATPYVSFPEFLLMSQEDRYRVVHMMQDFLVEQEQQSKYIMLNKSAKHTVFWSFLINKAYASDNGFHGAPCVYAGWPSAMEEIAGQLYCNNPGRYWASVPRYQNRGDQDPSYLEGLKRSQTIYNKVRKNKHVSITYETNEANELLIKLEPDSKCEPAKGAVICNPLIFGDLDGQPFCVASDADKDGYNASFLCERAVNKIKNQEDKGPYKKLMDGIIARAMEPENRPLFLSTLRNMYDMCLCSGDQDESGQYRSGMIAQVYAEKMFNSRTCAGILYQSKAILDHTSQNQDVSCQVFSDPVGDNRAWVKFVQQAHNNIAIETDNLTRNDFIRYLEISKTDARIAEQEEIKRRRDEARAQRGGVFCPVKIEEPDTPQADPPDETQRPEETPQACEIAIAQSEEDPLKLLVTFTPKEGKELNEFTLQPELQDKEEKENGAIVFTHTMESVQNTAIKAMLGEEEACSADFEAPVTDDPEPAVSECSLALEQKSSDDGVIVTATLTVGGEEIKKGTEGYSVSFVNASLPSEVEDNEEGNPGLAADEQMVSDTSSQQDEDQQENSEQIEGRQLASSEEGEAFSVVVPRLSEDQTIYANVTGAECDPASIKVAAKENESETSQTTRPVGGPMMPKPNLIQKRQRGGFFLKGTR